MINKMLNTDYVPAAEWIKQNISYKTIVKNNVEYRVLENITAKDISDKLREKGIAKTATESGISKILDTNLGLLTHLQAVKRGIIETKNISNKKKIELMLEEALKEINHLKNEVSGLKSKVYNLEHKY